MCNGSHREKKGREVRKRYILPLFRALGLKHLLIGITVMLQKLVLSISKKKILLLTKKAVPMASKRTGEPFRFQAKFRYILTAQGKPICATNNFAHIFVPT